jgi:hypothetical protein
LEAWNTYNVSENQCHDAFVKAKEVYYYSLVDDLSDINIMLKKWWSTVNEITVRKRNESISVLKNNDGHLVFYDKQKCLLLSQCFVEQTQLNEKDVEVHPVTKHTDSFRHTVL